MSEFEKTKQQIEEIKKQAEERKLALEKEQQHQKGEEKEKQDQEQALKQHIEKTFQAVVSLTPSLLNTVNSEVFEGKGAVRGWKEISRDLHTHTRYIDTTYEGVPERREISFTHRSKDLAAALHLPEVGSVCVSIPLEVGKEKKGPTKKIKDRIYVSISKDDKIYCSAVEDRPKGGILLSKSANEIFEQLEHELLKKSIDLYRRFYRP